MTAETPRDYLFGYTPGQHEPPQDLQVELARALLNGRTPTRGPVPVKALEIAQEIVYRADTVKRG